jgi:hypothetical protein
VSPNEIRRRFPNASPAFIKANAQDCPENPPPSPKPKRPVRHEPLATTKGKEKNLGRVIVRIKSFRTRLLDADNLVGGSKYFTDGLRHAGLISGDSEKEIILHVSQKKVATRKEECTQIEIEPVGLYDGIFAKSIAHKLVVEQTRAELIEKLWSHVSDSWNRQAFDAFMETMNDADLQQYIQVGRA